MSIIPPHEVVNHLLQHVGHLDSSSPEHVRIAPELLSQLVQSMFFASIATEEGRTGPLRVVYTETDPDRRMGSSRNDDDLLPWTWSPRLFKKPRPLEVDELTRLARVLQSRHSYILVGEVGGSLKVLGFAHEGFDGPFLCVLAPKPGLLQFQFTPEAVVFEYRRGDVRLAPPPVFLSEGPVRRRLIRASGSLGANPKLGTLYCTVAGALVHAMEAHGRGGILAILPETEESTQFHSFQDLSLQPEMRDLVELRTEEEALSGALPGSPEKNTLHAVHSAKRWHEETLRRLTGELAGYSGADGALLLGSDLEIVAFGVKLPILHGFDLVESLTPEPSEQPRPFDLSQLGSRHRAAASYAWTRSDALVFCASENGGTRCLLRRSGTNVVHVWSCRPVGRIGVPEALRRRI